MTAILPRLGCQTQFPRLLRIIDWRVTAIHETKRLQHLFLSLQVRRLVDDQHYVMKQIDIADMAPDKQALAAREAMIMAAMDHPNVVRYHDSFVDDGMLCIVMELCAGGDLQKALKRLPDGVYLPESIIWKIFLQLCIALDYLHSQRVLHRDLKTANIFLTDPPVFHPSTGMAVDGGRPRLSGLSISPGSELYDWDADGSATSPDGQGPSAAATSATGAASAAILDALDSSKVKIGDLGVARVLGSQSHFARTCTGTPYYLSPELVNGSPYDGRSDVWALGCCLYELCTLQHPFDAANQGALIFRIMQGSYEPVPAGRYSTELRELVGMLLRRDSKTRPGVSAILASTSVVSRAAALGIALPADAHHVDNDNHDDDDGRQAIGGGGTEAGGSNNAEARGKAAAAAAAEVSAGLRRGGAGREEEKRARRTERAGARQCGTGGEGSDWQGAKGSLEQTRSSPPHPGSSEALGLRGRTVVVGVARGSRSRVASRSTSARSRAGSRPAPVAVPAGAKPLSTSTDDAEGGSGEGAGGESSGSSSRHRRHRQRPQTSASGSTGSNGKPGRRGARDSPRRRGGDSDATVTPERRAVTSGRDRGGAVAARQVVGEWAAAGADGDAEGEGGLRRLRGGGRVAGTAMQDKSAGSRRVAQAPGHPSGRGRRHRPASQTPSGSGPNGRAPHSPPLAALGEGDSLTLAVTGVGGTPVSAFVGRAGAGSCRSASRSGARAGGGGESGAPQSRQQDARSRGDKTSALRLDGGSHAGSDGGLRQDDESPAASRRGFVPRDEAVRISAGHSQSPELRRRLHSRAASAAEPARRAAMDGRAPALTSGGRSRGGGAGRGERAILTGWEEPALLRALQRGNGEDASGTGRDQTASTGDDHRSPIQPAGYITGRSAAFDRASTAAAPSPRGGAASRAVDPDLVESEDWPVSGERVVQPQILPHRKSGSTGGMLPVPPSATDVARATNLHAAAWTGTRSRRAAEPAGNGSGLQSLASGGAVASPPHSHESGHGSGATGAATPWTSSGRDAPSTVSTSLGTGEGKEADDGDDTGAGAVEAEQPEVEVSYSASFSADYEDDEQDASYGAGLTSAGSAQHPDALKSAPEGHVASRLPAAQAVARTDGLIRLGSGESLAVAAAAQARDGKPRQSIVVPMLRRAQTGGRDAHRLAAAPRERVAATGAGTWSEGAGRGVQRQSRNSGWMLEAGDIVHGGEGEGVTWQIRTVEPGERLAPAAPDAFAGHVEELEQGEAPDEHSSGWEDRNDARRLSLGAHGSGNGAIHAAEPLLYTHPSASDVGAASPGSDDDLYNEGVALPGAMEDEDGRAGAVCARRDDADVGGRWRLSSGRLSPIHSPSDVQEGFSAPNMGKPDASHLGAMSSSDSRSPEHLSPQQRRSALHAARLRAAAPLTASVSASRVIAHRASAGYRRGRQDRSPSGRASRAANLASSRVAPIARPLIEVGIDNRRDEMTPKSLIQTARPDGAAISSTSPGDITRRGHDGGESLGALYEVKAVPGSTRGDWVSLGVPNPSPPDIPSSLQSHGYTTLSRDAEASTSHHSAAGSRDVSTEPTARDPHGPRDPAGDAKRSGRRMMPLCTQREAEAEDCVQEDEDEDIPEDEDEDIPEDEEGQEDDEGDVEDDDAGSWDAPSVEGLENYGNEAFIPAGSREDTSNADLSSAARQSQDDAAGPERAAERGAARACTQSMQHSHVAARRLRAALDGAASLPVATGVADLASRAGASDIAQTSESPGKATALGDTRRVLGSPAGPAHGVLSDPKVAELFHERRALLARAGETALDCADALTGEQCLRLADAVSDATSLTLRGAATGSTGRSSAGGSDGLILDDPLAQLLVFRTLHLAGRLRDNALLLTSAVKAATDHREQEASVEASQSWE